MSSAALQLENTDTHVIVNIPMQMKRRGGRRQIVVPDTLMTEEESKPAYHESMVLAIVRAHRWQELLESGKYSTLTEIAQKAGVNPSYAARIYRLTLLAPDIIEAILEGREPDGFTMRKLAGRIPMYWEDQRRLFGFDGTGYTAELSTLMLRRTA